MSVTSDTEQSALTMDAATYARARAVAAAGKLPPLTQRAAATPPPADDAPADPPAASQTSTSNSAPLPTANELGGGRGALDMSPEEYRVARAAMIREADCGRMPRSDYGLGMGR
jgi:hypothetical protein